MPHQCVKCGSLYDDGSSIILKGCECGARLFFYVKKESLEKAKKQVSNLTKEDKKKIENDVFDLIGAKIDKTRPVVLDFESINILKPGKYELDLVNLFNKKQPLIYKLDEGKYMIDLPETFKKFKETEN